MIDYVARYSEKHDEFYVTLIDGNKRSTYILPDEKALKRFEEEHGVGIIFFQQRTRNGKKLEEVDYFDQQRSPYWTFNKRC